MPRREKRDPQRDPLRLAEVESVPLSRDVARTVKAELFAHRHDDDFHWQVIQRIAERAFERWIGEDRPDREVRVVARFRKPRNYHTSRWLSVAERKPGVYVLAVVGGEFLVHLVGWCRPEALQYNQELKQWGRQGRYLWPMHIFRDNFCVRQEEQPAPEEDRPQTA